MNFNEYLFFAINNVIYKSAALDRLVYFLAQPFGFMVIGFALLTLSIIFLRHDRIGAHDKVVFSELMSVVMSMSVAWFISFIIKIITHVPRPFLVHPSSQLLFLYGGYNSFPSGHATIFFALATAIFYYNRIAGSVFYGFAILISLSRVAAGIHYPIDIVVGAMIGVIVGRLIFMAHQKMLKHKSLT